MIEKYLNRAEAAKYIQEQGLPCSKGTLGKIASTGGGPLYRVFGNRAVYTPNDLNTWVAGRLSAPRYSTSQGVQA